MYGVKDENMSSDAFVAMASSATGIGDPDIVSQHIFGSSKVRKLSPTSATAWRQMRAEHMRITQHPRKVGGHGHAHGALQFFYEKVDGRWKISGLRGWADFMEGDILIVFPSWPGKDKARWAY